MASLWNRSGYDIKVEMSAETYQVRAHFKALIKAGFFLCGFPVGASVRNHRTIEFFSDFLEFLGKILEFFGQKYQVFGKIFEF